MNPVIRPATASVVVLALASTALGGCGDDEASERDSAFCQLAVELSKQEDFPTAAQLKDYRDAAPEEIADSVTVVVDAFLEAIGAGDPTAAYSDPAVEVAFGPIEAYEADTCGIEQKP